MLNRIFINLLFLSLMTIASLANAQTKEMYEAIERGNELFHRGQYGLAIFEYRAALHWPGEHQARARFNIGVCYHRQDLLREAVDEYRAAIKLRNNQYPLASYALGIALQDLHQYRDARDAFEQAVNASGGNNAEALFELALESQRAGDDRASFDHYQRAIIQSKDRIPACHNNLGVILVKWGQLDEAMREFGVALKHSRGKFVEARENLALCQQMINSPSQRLIANLKMSEAGVGAVMRAE
jgi:tetratricopeptide (TPR) repeat protein